jgi:hypothetical protein
MTAGRRVRPEDLELLREVLMARAPDRLEQFIEKVRTDSLASAERAQLCELIGAEFASSGLDAESEPTPRGERLERLLDTINRPSIQGSR